MKKEGDKSKGSKQQHNQQASGSSRTSAIGSTANNNTNDATAIKRQKQSASPFLAGPSDGGKESGTLSSERKRFQYCPDVGAYVGVLVSGILNSVAGLPWAMSDDIVVVPRGSGLFWRRSSLTLWSCMYYGGLSLN